MWIICCRWAEIRASWYPWFVWPRYCPRQGKFLFPICVWWLLYLRLICAMLGKEFGSMIRDCTSLGLIKQFVNSTSDHFSREIHGNPGLIHADDSVFLVIRAQSSHSLVGFVTVSGMIYIKLIFFTWKWEGLAVYSSSFRLLVINDKQWWKWCAMLVFFFFLLGCLILERELSANILKLGPCYRVVLIYQFESQQKRSLVSDKDTSNRIIFCIQE